MWGRGILINKKEDYMFVGHFKDGLRHGVAYKVPIGNCLKMSIPKGIWEEGILNEDAGEGYANSENIKIS